ncbi:hypothetical protein [Prevotella histicola]|jgi:hypothetical protein|nr:hypothetical protein [Prevotella histicola]
MQYKDEKAKIPMRFMEDEEPKGRHSTVVLAHIRTRLMEIM